MEHEVFVPVAAERLRAVLADPVRVARVVPGLQQDAGAEPVTGRLKMRVGGHTITYRGAARIRVQEDGSYAVEGDATEARGTGSVKLVLTLRVREAEGGSTVRFEGTASADGRIAKLPAEAVGSAVARLLNRFGEQLGAAAGEGAAGDGDGDDGEILETLAPGEFETRVTSDFETTPDADDAAAPPVPADEVPPPSPDPGADEPYDAGAAKDAKDEEEPEAETEAEAQAGAGVGEAPVAEAAHARRTMIGRSAEEVDHAPPRGRYAPVPAPQSATPGSTLRWAAPVAALVLASAIVVGRALRRRR